MAMIKGLGLGMANVAVTGIVLAVAERTAGPIAAVFLYGLVPGITVGALIGALAELIKSWSPALRSVLLAAPAVAVVFTLAVLVDEADLAPIASIPAIAAAIVLERWTRHVMPATIPPATAQPKRRIAARCYTARAWRCRAIEIPGQRPNRIPGNPPNHLLTRLPARLLAEKRARSASWRSSTATSRAQTSRSITARHSSSWSR